jgi:hypothetical protein
MNRRSVLGALAGLPAIAVLPPLPALAEPPDPAVRAAAAKIHAKYQSDAAFRALVQRAPFDAFAQSGLSRDVSARILGYEMGCTRFMCGTGTCLTANKAGAATGRPTITARDDAKTTPTTFTPLAVCALTFAGKPPAGFAERAHLPPATDVKSWRALGGGANAVR